MGSSDPPPASAPPRPVRRWRGLIAAVVAVAIVAPAGAWYNQHRKISWSETLDPSYWLRRWRGDDLYDPQLALLMHGNRSLPEVALTFDDGPHRPSCGRILEVLRQYHIHATFFDVGKNMVKNPDLLRLTLASGNEVGNHTFTHQRLTVLDPRSRHREINNTDITFYRITGDHLAFLRPPGMRYDPEVLTETSKLGYIVVGYDTASHDYDPHYSIDTIVQRTVDRAENGSIILLHDYAHPAEALPRIIEALRAEGFRFVTISEMVSHLPQRQRTEAERFLASHDDTNLVQRAALNAGRPGT